MGSENYFDFLVGALGAGLGTGDFVTSLGEIVRYTLAGGACAIYTFATDVSGPDFASGDSRLVGHVCVEPMG